MASISSKAVAGTVHSVVVVAAAGNVVAAGTACLGDVVAASMAWQAVAGIVDSVGTVAAKTVGSIPAVAFLASTCEVLE